MHSSAIQTFEDSSLIGSTYMDDQFYALYLSSLGDSGFLSCLLGCFALYSFNAYHLYSVGTDSFLAIPAKY